MRAERLILLALAAIGGVLLAVIVGTFWMTPNDNLAYWIAAERLVAGEPIYATALRRSSRTPTTTRRRLRRRSRR